MVPNLIERFIKRMEDRAAELERRAQWLLPEAVSQSRASEATARELRALANELRLAAIL